MCNLSNTIEYLELIEKYRSFSENPVKCIWLFDLTNNHFKYISPSIINLRGLTVEEAMNEKLQDSLTPKSMKKIKKYHVSRLLKFIAGDRRENIVSNIDEYEQYCKDGTIKLIEISTKFILKKQTNTINVLGISTDVTERKKLEEKLANELKEKDVQLKNLLNNVEKHFEIYKSRIYYFKKFSVYGANSNFPVKWRTSKCEELFAYLVQNIGTGIPKWQICEVLWPEYSLEKIDNQLHTTIYKMKKTLTSINIKFDLKFINGCYWMDLYNVYIDIAAFNSIFDSDIVVTEDTIEKYKKAFSLYKSTYLEENGYIWSLCKKEYYSKKYNILGTHLVNYYMKKHDYTSAEKTLKIILEKSPLSESAYEMLLKLYFINNDSIAFFTNYNTMKELFNSELGIEPTHYIKDLYNSMLSSY